MDEKQAKRLGKQLLQRRTELGLSIRDMERLTGIDNSYILRIEQGHYKAPGPDKLARLAETLQISLADLYAQADYVVPEELPEFVPYLRTKYRGLPPEEVERIRSYVARIAHKHGVDIAGPGPGEDES